MNKKTVFGLVTLLVVVSVGVAFHRKAHAGANINATVSIVNNFDGSGHASGAMGVARSSADGQAFIGCGIHINGPTGATWGCTAQNSSMGGSATCTVDLNSDQWVSSFLFLTEMMNNDSYIYFQWDPNKTCNILRVENDSRYAPKVLP
jgi:hypothetical protein